MWLEIYGHQGEGIGGAAAFEGWEVLILNYLPRLAPRAVMDMQRHTETDEMFILSQGRAILFLAGDGDEPGDRLEAAALEQGRVYRVRRNVWHTQVMTPEAKLSAVTVLPVSISRCVCESMKPGKSRQPSASQLSS